MTATPEAVLDFWRAAGPDKWFEKDPELDRAIAAHFLSDYELAAHGGLADWETTPSGALALLLMLDQFPRNMFRGDARAFATDPAARAVAGRALARGFDQQVPEAERIFFYLPFMHSESLADQERSLVLTLTCDETQQRYAKIHADIIRRFGRFPHRNAALGRTTTPDEEGYLDSGGFAG